MVWAWICGKNKGPLIAIFDRRVDRFVYIGVTSLWRGGYSELDSSPYDIPRGNQIENRPGFFVYY